MAVWNYVFFLSTWNQTSHSSLMKPVFRIWSQWDLGFPFQIGQQACQWKTSWWFGLGRSVTIPFYFRICRIDWLNLYQLAEPPNSRTKKQCLSWSLSIFRISNSWDQQLGLRKRRNAPIPFFSVMNGPMITTFTTVLVRNDESRWGSSACISCCVERPSRCIYIKLELILPTS